MFADCPRCQQKLRREWHRCPRCGMGIPRQAAPAGAPPAPGPTNRSWKWVLVAGAVAATGVTGMSVFGGATSAPPANAARQALPQPVRERGFGAAADPETVAAYQALDAKRAGSVAYSGGDVAGALEQFEAAVEAAPGDAEAQNNLGQVLVRLGRAKDALAHFDAAVSIDERRWSYRFNRARAYTLLNQWKEAAAEYDTAAQLFPDDYVTAYNLGLARLQLKKYAASAAALEHAVAMAPGETGFLISLGTAYVGAQQHDRARQTFERFLELAPDDPEAARVKGLLEAMTAAGE
jgi:tetratricopeptide (TPR) repeat protein